MSRLLATAPITVSGSQSRIGFETTGTAAWPIWDRYLTLDGRRAYNLGNICGTCRFMFQRLEGAQDTVNVSALADRLNAGLSELDPDTLNALRLLLPDGAYRALLLEIRPRRVHLGSGDDYFSAEQVVDFGIDGYWGLPHHPQVTYFREARRLVADDPRRALFEFVVPLVAESVLDQERITAYRAALTTTRPTAVALSVLDVKSPTFTGKPPASASAHWCFAHYLLDGHHKVVAAADLDRSITLVAFVATQQGVSEAAEIEALIASLAAGGSA